MTKRDHLIEQHIIEYESKLKHIDELLSHAQDRAGSGDAPDHVTDEIGAITDDRNRAQEQFDQLKQGLPDWEQKAISEAGPFAVLDAIVRRLEKLAEHLD